VNDRPVLLISQDLVGSHMAGPSIRYFHLAQSLARHMEVVLAIPHESPADLDTRELAIARYVRREWPSIESLVEAARVVICPSDIVSDFPQLAQSDAFLVVDGYDPLLAEWLALNSHLSTEAQDLRWWRRMCDLNRQYLAADFFICGSERQRDWWLGLLEANGRINAWTFGEDPSLRRLIDVVPYGIPATAPRHTRQVLKGVWSGIGMEDRVVLWGGGMWPWLDPVTAVEAIARIWPRHQNVRLVFPGVSHPSAWMQGMPTRLEATRQAAVDSGLLDQGVLFVKWLPYADWPNVLLESDVALSLGLDTLETRLAFRSRVVEYIWAGLPVIATRGDATSDLVAEYGLGRVVSAQDVQGIAEALEDLLEAPARLSGPHLDQARHDLGWDRVVEPLVEFCRNPRRAPDKLAMGKRLGNPYYVEERDHYMHERNRYAHEGHLLVQARDQLVRERDEWRERYERFWTVRLRRWAYRLKESLGKGSG
jgi:glycosyltransferase involved in cell wall biosynthesis